MGFGLFEVLFCLEIGVVVLVVVSGWEGRARVWVVGGVEEEAVGAAVRLRLPGFAVGVPSLVVGMASMCDRADRKLLVLVVLVGVELRETGRWSRAGREGSR